MVRRISQLAVFLIVAIFLTIYYRPCIPSQAYPESTRVIDTRSLFLTEEQCTNAFPALFDEIEKAGASFDLKRLRDKTPGLVQGRIKDGKLYIISTAPDNILHRIPATLQALHRAIITSPTSLPDTIFALNINDIPRENTWSFARSDDDLTPKTPFLMPHHSSWSWPIPSLGPLDGALNRISAVEARTTFREKVDKVVWRGTPWFNPDWRMGLRPMLLEVAGEREWADVEAWGQGQNNSIDAEGFCMFKYIIYAEGKTYSGRLPYHLACNSVILTPPPTYLLHTTHLLRPLFSSHLLSSASHHTHPSAPPLVSYPLPNTSTTWPLSYPAFDANIIFVSPDWSDLEDVVIHLRKHPKIAQGIADRQRRLWVEQGMLSEGAEVCYWRKLIHGWAKRVRVNESEWEEGMRFESFALLGKTSFEI